MMKSTNFILTSVLLVASLQAACGQKIKSSTEIEGAAKVGNTVKVGDVAKVEDAQLKILGFPKFQILPCTVKKDTVSVIKLVIDQDLNIKRVVRDVREKNYNSSTDDEADPSTDGNAISEPIPPISSPTSKATRMDLDLRPYLNGIATSGKTKSVLIKIKLKGNLIGFTPGVDPVYNSNNDEMFCDLKRVNDKVVKFHAMRSTVVGAEGAFAIPIVIQDKDIGDYNLPIIIDPKVKNNG